MAQSWMEDIVASWWVILVSSVTALVLGYLYLFIIRLIGGLIIYVSLVVSMIAFLALGGFTWYWRDVKYKPEESTYDYMTWAAYTAWILSGVVLLLVCCCWDAIKIGIAVFKTTSQYVQSNMHIFLLPLLCYIIIAIWSTAWIGGASFIFSTGNPEPREDFPFLTEVKWTVVTRYAFFYDVFGLFWINAFIIGAA